MSYPQTWVEYWCDWTRNFLLSFRGALPSRRVDIRKAPNGDGYIFSIGEENSSVTTRIELENILRII
jgi:hypothetical protein